MNQVQPPSKQEAETGLKELKEAWAREIAYIQRLAELEQRLHEARSVGGGGRGTETLSQAPEAVEVFAGSFAWAIARRLSALRRRLAPEATRRDRWLRLCLHGLRLWRREGVRALCRRAAADVKHRLKARPLAFLLRFGQARLPLSGFECWLACQRLTPVEEETQRQFASDYERWFAKQQLTPAERAAQRQTASAFAYRPLISILTPTCNPPKDILQATIASLQAQTYDHWELCVADGGSTNPAVRRVLRKAMSDPRVRVRFLDGNGGISHNSNVCLEMAQGEFIALLDHDDLLAPSALFEVVRRLNEDPQLDFLYSDKDLISEDGRQHFRPFFKPAWSPDIMLMANYLTHFNVLRTERVRAAGGFRPETDGAQDWDLFLRVLDGTSRIAHIPKVLYHWRFWSRSTSAGIAAKPYAVAAQLRTINDHCRRAGRKAEVAIDSSSCWPRLRRGSLPAKDITVIIRSDGSNGRLPALLRKLRQQQGRDRLAIVVAHAGPLPSSLHDYYQSLTRDHQVGVVVQGADESVAALLNRAAEGHEADLLLFLHDWLDPVEGWLDEMVVCTEQPGVAVVGGQIFDPNYTILQGALVLRRDGQVLPLYAGVSWGERNCFGDTNWYRNCSAVGGACLMIRREAFVRAGGFNPDYQQSGHDVDLCCRVRAQGQRILYDPYATFVAPSVEGRFIPLGKDDRERLHGEWQSLLADGDPYFNLNLAENSPRPWVRSEEEDAALPEGGTRPLPAPRSPDADGDIRWVRPNEAMQTSRALATLFDFSPAHREASRRLQAANAGPLDIGSVNWFIPGFTNAGYGGIHTILRLANYLRLHHGTVNRFYYLGHQPAEALRASIAQSFPALEDQIVRPFADDSDLENLEYADACVATLWTTAYAVLKFQRTRRKCYLLQDYEPLFYPAGSTSAQVEATYRFGFHGLANTRPLQEIYQREYGGLACHFTPAVETSLFYPVSRPSSPPWRIFFYGRPNNPRNAFELGTEALRRIKERLGEKVQILAAGEYWRPADFGLENVLVNLGVLSIRQTAELYRTCDLGLVLMFTRHPSYLPFEFMASGCLVVTNRNVATAWLLRDEENCLLAEPSVESLAAAIQRGLSDAVLRERITRGARAEIEAEYADWKSQLEKVFTFMCDPGSDADIAVAPSIVHVAA